MVFVCLLSDREGEANPDRLGLVARCGDRTLFSELAGSKVSYCYDTGLIEKRPTNAQRRVLWSAIIPAGRTIHRNCPTTWATGRFRNCRSVETIIAGVPS